MAKNTVSDWDTTASNNTDVGGVNIAEGCPPSNLNNAIRESMAQLKGFYNQVFTSAGLRVLAEKGHIYGLTLSNNVTDATNDIDIAAGDAASDGTTAYLLTLASVLTKRLDAAWAVGSGNGGLDAGSIANTTYHVWLIQRSDTGVVDALFSTSATAPTMPANYDRKRRIGSIIRSGATILAFRQLGNRFMLTTGVQIRSSTGAASNILLACTVPLGIRVAPIISSTMLINVSSSVSNAVGDGDMSTTPLGFQANNTPASVTSANSNVISGEVFTDTSGQIRWTTIINGGSILSNIATSLGWFDDRGKNG